MLNNPNVRKNLKPFKKGVDERRNLKGAPKLPDLRELLDKVLGKETKGKTAAMAILDALQRKAAKGDVRAAEVLLNRSYGLPKQFMELTGKDGDAIMQPMTDNQVDRIIQSLRENAAT